MSELSYWKLLTRRKTISDPNQHILPKTSKYKRLQLPNIGVATTFGIGIFSIIGFVARNVAGPSVVVCIAVAALISFLSGGILTCNGQLSHVAGSKSILLPAPCESCPLHVDIPPAKMVHYMVVCFWYIFMWNLTFAWGSIQCKLLFLSKLLVGTFYAELSSRITKNASTYTYIYVCIGEIQAFIVGWTLILEYIIGVAIVSDSIGLHVDTLLNNTIKNSFKEFAPMHWNALATYFDFIGFAIPIFFAIIVNIGLKRSEFLNKVFFVISVAVMLFIVIAGAFRADANHWYTIPDPLHINLNQGIGGFAPFEYFGILKGIAVCIFLFIGFDVTGTGTRWKSMYGIVSFLFGTMALFGIGTVATLAEPFYLFDAYAQLPQIFNIPSWYTAYWIIAIGGVIALFASMYGLMFSMQITVLAMAKDLLIPKSFDSDEHTKPIIEILCAGLIAGLLAGLFQMAHLIDMLSIGIIFGFMAMAFAVVMFRYSNEYEYGSVSTIDVAESNNLPDKDEKPTTIAQIARQLFNTKKQKKPTNASYAVVKILLVGLGLVSLGLAWMANFAYLNIYNSEVWAITVTVVLLVLLIIIIFLISLQPMRKLNAIFMVPFVPLSPAISIIVNIYLMMSLHYYAWIRFGIWIIFGLFIYFYCIRKYSRRSKNAAIKSNTLTKNGFKNHGFVGDIERRPSFSFNSQSQMTYKSDDIMETENENVDQSKINGFESEQEIPISPKSTKKSKAPIPMSFKTENQTESSASLVTKSRTPSPNSNKAFDDIVLISEVIDTLTEMKEPNGKTYFVDEIRTATSAGDTHDDAEQKTAIEYLDDVLKKEEVNDDIVRAKAEENLIATSVVAVVHLNGILEEEPPLIENIEKEQASSEDVIAEEISTFAVGDADSKEAEELISESLSDSAILQNVSPQEDEVAVDSIQITKANIQSHDAIPQIVNPEEDYGLDDVKKRSLIDDSDAEKSMTFKERLAMLLGQQPVAEVRRISPRVIDRPSQSTPDPKLKHSKSEPDIFNSMQGVFQDIRSKYEPTEPHGSKKLLPMTATDDIQIDDSNTIVPVPPKFDPFIYKTVGTRHTARTALTIGDGNENIIHHKPPSTAPVIMDNDHADHNDVMFREKSSEDDDQTRMISIKDRLESILKRGPPDRYSRPKSIAPVVATVDDVSVTTNVARIDSDKVDEDAQEMVRIKESKGPFDTVRKQKVLFNDVLKSMGAETRPSVIRANSMTKSRQKPATIEDARNALKHVTVDWKENVN